MTSSFSLIGKKAIVTGASRGLGSAIAVALAQAGAEVAVTSRSLASLDDVCAAIRDGGGTARPFALDVRDADACECVVAEIASGFGELHVLVNNAGTEEVRPALKVDEALWDRIVDTNLKGAFFCAQSAARRMIATGTPGAIINLCSLASSVGIPTAVPYSSSKAGLLGMTRALSAEWARHRIRVNAIAPGYFRTAMTEVFYQTEGWQQTMLSKIPLGRFGDPADLGGTAIFLASDASAYITGQCIAVDGGFLASI